MTEKAKPLIKLKNDCRVHIEKYSIIQDVGKIIREIPNLGKIKNDIELLKYIVSLVENLIHPKVKDKLKAGDIAFELFCELFPSMPADEKELVKKNIDYLVNNNQIEKISFIKKNKNRIVNFFSSK
jgi:hypothetical protein